MKMHERGQKVPADYKFPAGQTFDAHEAELQQLFPLREYFRGRRKIQDAFITAVSFFNLFNSSAVTRGEGISGTVPSASMKQNICNSFVEVYVNGQAAIEEAFREQFGGFPEAVWEHEPELESLRKFVANLQERPPTTSLDMRVKILQGTLLKARLVRLHEKLFKKVRPGILEHFGSEAQ